MKKIIIIIAIAVLILFIIFFWFWQDKMLPWENIMSQEETKNVEKTLCQADSSLQGYVSKCTKLFRTVYIKEQHPKDIMIADVNDIFYYNKKGNMICDGHRENCGKYDGRCKYGEWYNFCSFGYNQSPNPIINFKYNDQ